jgi:hypothetical protein
MVRSSPLSIVMLVLGCAPSVSSGDTGSGNGDDDSSTSGVISGTATAASTTATTTTATTTTTTGTPPGCTEDFVPGCQSYCAAVVTCDPDNGPYEDCVTGCVTELAGYTPECQVAYCEAYACVGTLDCATLEAGSADCDAMLAAAGDQCGRAETDGGDSGDTACSASIGPDGMSCVWTCKIDGIEQALDCAEGTCTCLENGVETASCPDSDICELIDSIDDYAKGCCGW